MIKLAETKFKQLTSTELKPEGWLLRQLQIQANSLSGNLDKVWPDIKDSKWIGGDNEGWERVPYWLDGAVPLAYLLEDADLIERVNKFINAIIEKQCDDGWICPCEVEQRRDYDVWAGFLICKVLVVYHDCTNDERIEDVLYSALKNLKAHISVQTLFRWSATRWYECLIPLLWLYERRPEQWMIDMANLLKLLGTDFHKMFEEIEIDFPKTQSKYWNHINHVVNVAMALKSDALMSRITGGDPNKSAKKFYQNVMKYHSMATGHFTGDECLAGDSPIQGSECCSVVEAAYSYEKLIEIGGDVLWSDLLEKTTFNNLPATISPDMWSHQYVQMANQISCTKLNTEDIPFVSNKEYSHNFGLEPNFGCCTANFNQGWPKYALSTIMKSANGIAITSYAPSIANTVINNVKLSVRQDTMYPFRDNVKIIVKVEEEVEFDLMLRIPSFAKSATINGETINCCGAYHIINQKWCGETEILINFEFETVLIDRPLNNKALTRGPLVYALPIKEKWEKVEYTKDGVERKFPYCDYEISPLTNWNYAFCNDNFVIEHFDIDEFPFSNINPPVILKTKMVRVEWGEKNGVCFEQANAENILGEQEEIYLQPYGCTNLRMTEMPFVKI